MAHNVVDFQAEQRSVHDNDGPDWIQLTRTQNPAPDLVGFQAAIDSLGAATARRIAHHLQGQRRRRQTSSSLDGTVKSEVDDRAVRDALATRVGGSGWALLLIYMAIIGGFSALIWLNDGWLWRWRCGLPPPSA